VLTRQPLGPNRGSNPKSPVFLKLRDLRNPCRRTCRKRNDLVLSAARNRTPAPKNQSM